MYQKNEFHSTPSLFFVYNQAKFVVTIFGIQLFLILNMLDKKKYSEVGKVRIGLLKRLTAQLTITYLKKHLIIII